MILDPVAAPSVDGWRVTLRQGLDGATLQALPASFDPSVLRVGGEQRSVVPTLRDGALGFDVLAPLACDALLGLSIAAEGSTPAQHVKAIVAMRAADDSSQPTSAVAARIGLLAELTPLLDPTTLHAGDDLPVKLAVDLGDARAVAIDVEHRPLGGGSIIYTTTRTGDTGVAIVRMQGDGSYALTARVHVGGLDGTRTAALTTLTFALGGKR